MAIDDDDTTALERSKSYFLRALERLPRGVLGHDDMTKHLTTGMGFSLVSLRPLTQSTMFRLTALTTIGVDLAGKRCAYIPLRDEEHGRMGNGEFVQYILSLFRAG